MLTYDARENGSVSETEAYARSNAAQRTPGSQVNSKLRLEHQRGHTSFNNLDIVVPSPRAMICRVIQPTSRLPVSISERWPRFRSKYQAISLWVHFLAFLRFRLRIPSWARRAHQTIRKKPGNWRDYLFTCDFNRCLPNV